MDNQLFGSLRVYCMFVLFRYMSRFPYPNTTKEVIFEKSATYFTHLVAPARSGCLHCVCACKLHVKSECACKGVHVLLHECVCEACKLHVNVRVCVHVRRVFKVG